VPVVITNYYYPAFKTKCRESGASPLFSKNTEAEGLKKATGVAQERTAI
jgi:hypothetical protein